MLIAVVGMGMALVPVILVVGMLLLATRIQRARAEAVARQIGVTDAIHLRFGPVVAPVVERRRGGRWRAVIPVPFSQPDVVAGVVDVAERTLAGADSSGHAGVEILLIAQRAAAPLSRRCSRQPISQPRGGAPLAA